MIKCWTLHLPVSTRRYIIWLWDILEHIYLCLLTGLSCKHKFLFAHFLMFIDTDGISSQLKFNVLLINILCNSCKSPLEVNIVCRLLPASIHQTSKRYLVLSRLPSPDRPTSVSPNSPSASALLSDSFLFSKSQKWRTWCWSLRLLPVTPSHRLVRFLLSDSRRPCSKSTGAKSKENSSQSLAKR